MPSVKHKLPWFLVGLFILSCILRIGSFAVAYAHSGHDLGAVIFGGDGYKDIAENIVAGHGYSSQLTQPFIPDRVRVPLYPLFIAGGLTLAKTYPAIVLVQILLASVLPLLAYWIALLVVENRAIAKSVGVLIALEPMFLVMSFTLLSETVATFLFYGFLILLLLAIRKNDTRLLAGSACVLGLATLARPTTEYLPIALAIFFVWRGHQERRLRAALKHAVIYIAVFVATLSPWLMFTSRVIGQPQLTSQGLIAYYTALLPSAIALENHAAFEPTRHDFLIEQGINEDYNALTPAVLKAMSSHAIPLALQHPKGLTMSVLMSVTTFATQDGYINYLVKLGLVQNFSFHNSSLVMLFRSPGALASEVFTILLGPGILILLGRIFWTGAFLLFVWCLIRWLKDPVHRSVGVLFLFFTGYFALTASLTGFGMNARYRMPLDPVIAACAFVVVGGVLKRWRRSASAQPSGYSSPEQTLSSVVDADQTRHS